MQERERKFSWCKLVRKVDKTGPYAVIMSKLLIDSVFRL